MVHTTAQPSQLLLLDTLNHPPRLLYSCARRLVLLCTSTCTPSRPTQTRLIRAVIAPRLIETHTVPHILRPKAHPFDIYRCSPRTMSQLCDDQSIHPLYLQGSTHQCPAAHWHCPLKGCAAATQQPANNLPQHSHTKTTATVWSHFCHTTAIRCNCTLWGVRNTLDHVHHARDPSCLPLRVQPDCRH